MRMLDYYFWRHSIVSDARIMKIERFFFALMSKIEMNYKRTEIFKFIYQDLLLRVKNL